MYDKDIDLDVGNNSSVSKPKMKINISKKGLSIIGAIIFLIILISLIIIVNPLQYIDFNGINIGGRNLSSDLNEDLNSNELENKQSGCEKATSELFLGRVAVLSDGNNINSMISPKNQNALNILIIENKEVTSVILNDSNGEIELLINVLKENNISKIVSLSPQNFATILKENNVDCYYGWGTIDGMINSEEKKPPVDASIEYCKQLDVNFSEINGKILLYSDRNNINSRISPRGVRAPFFFIYENNELLEIIENEFLDSNEIIIDFVNLLKTKNIKTIFSFFSNKELEKELETNEIKCYKTAELIKDLVE